MNKISLLGSVGMLVGGLVISNYAFAQSDNEQITVTAPYITHETQSVLGVGNKGVYDVNSLTKEVAYNDLDLSKPSDDDRFIQRINDTAKESCDELRAKYPDPPHAPVGNDDCMKAAVGQAMIVADDLIGRAKVAMVTPVAPPVQTAEVAPEPEPAPQVEAQATTPEPAPMPAKQDRN